MRRRGPTSAGCPPQNGHAAMPQPGWWLPDGARPRSRRSDRGQATKVGRIDALPLQPPMRTAPGGGEHILLALLANRPHRPAHRFAGGAGSRSWSSMAGASMARTMFDMARCSGSSSSARRYGGARRLLGNHARIAAAATSTQDVVASTARARVVISGRPRRVRVGSGGPWRSPRDHAASNDGPTGPAQAVRSGALVAAW